MTFGDMVSGTLGIKAETKKSDIGVYFTKIAETMKLTKAKLNEILEKNGRYEKVKEKVVAFIATIDKIAEGAETAAVGASGSNAIGNAVKNQFAVAADKPSVISLVKGIKFIVGVVLKESEGNADATKIQDEKKDIGKLFGNQDNDSAQEAEAAKANASVGAVSGADILKAIAKSKESPDVNNADGIEKAKDAGEIAVAPAVNDKKEIKDSEKKDAVIAGGIALRAMAKDGKFAAKSGDDKHANAINGLSASVLNKTLSTLVIAIRNTVDNGLKEINEVLAKVKQEDKAAEVAANGQQ